MRMNISVIAEAVSEIEAGPYSVDMAVFNDAGMDPQEIAAQVIDMLEREARKARAPRGVRKVPAMAQTESDYPLDPEQD